MIYLVLEADILNNTCNILQSRFSCFPVGEKCAYGDFLGKLEERLHPDDKEAVLTALDTGRLQDKLLRKEEEQLPARLIKDGAEEWITGSITCILISYGPALVTVQEDRTVEELKEALYTARKNERAKTNFLARMSHDIRTPINGIIGMTDIARSVEGNPEKTTDCLNKIRMSSDYLLMLINNILDMSKIESGKMERTRDIISIDELVQRMKDTYSLMVEKKAVRYRVDTDGVTIRECVGDKLWLYQIINNLLSNAFKFVGQEGRVSLCIRQKGIENKSVFFQFTVMDDGDGISKEFRERIYEPFVQEKTKESSEGTGLGLSICRELIERMGGTIQVDSKKGVGTRFDVLLPFEVKDGKAEDSPEVEESYELAGKRVLLAEDNELNMEVALFLLEQKELLVETAENGARAVELFEGSEPGYYDAILMDVRMPVMDGMEATRRIRSLERKDAAAVPIIAMTANAFKEDMDDCLAAGMDAHIAKPIEKADMYGILNRCLTLKPCPPED